MNKIILVASLNFYNFTFWIEPASWIVHNPHAATRAAKDVSAGGVGQERGSAPGTRPAPPDNSGSDDEGRLAGRLRLACGG
jgi:hypothetical protein